jgi:hypothetical protein
MSQQDDLPRTNEEQDGRVQQQASPLQTNSELLLAEQPAAAPHQQQPTIAEQLRLLASQREASSLNNDLNSSSLSSSDLYRLELLHRASQQQQAELGLMGGASSTMNHSLLESLLQQRATANLESLNSQYAQPSYPGVNSLSHLDALLRAPNQLQQAQAHYGTRGLFPSILALQNYSMPSATSFLLQSQLHNSLLGGQTILDSSVLSSLQNHPFQSLESRLEPPATSVLPPNEATVTLSTTSATSATGEGVKDRITGITLGPHTAARVTTISDPQRPRPGHTGITFGPSSSAMNDTTSTSAGPLSSPDPPPKDVTAPLASIATSALSSAVLPQLDSTNTTNEEGSDQETNNKTGKKRRRRKKTPSFALILYDLLVDAEAEGNDNIISFTPTGNAFQVHHPQKCEQMILPRYFRTKKIDSFKRQVSIYGFERIPFGPEEGAFAHKDFRRGRRDLAQSIRPLSSRSRTAWQPDFTAQWK